MTNQGWSLHLGAFIASLTTKHYCFGFFCNYCCFLYKFSVLFHTMEMFSLSPFYFFVQQRVIFVSSWVSRVSFQFFFLVVKRLLRFVNKRLHLLVALVAKRHTRRPIYVHPDCIRVVIPVYDLWGETWGCRTIVVSSLNVIQQTLDYFKAWKPQVKGCAFLWECPTQSLPWRGCSGSRPL